MLKQFCIDGREIGSDKPPYIIAEMSGNHNGSLERAFEIMEAAKNAGADAVKIQTYTADTITLDHDGEGFNIETGGLWDGRTLHDLFNEAHTPWEWHEKLFEKGNELGITVFSSPFDPTAITFLETFAVPAYKIASFEIVDLELLKLTAETGKPVILSTGMATLSEIELAVNTLQENNVTNLALLHCVSGYPTPAEDINLETVGHLSKTFNVVTGLSDHTKGIAVPVAAVAMGASIIEKHLTLRREDGGPDAEFSLEPEEFTEMVDSCQTAWKAKGKVDYSRKKSEAPNLVFRRSLYVVKDIKQGEILTKENVRSIRPGYGLSPHWLSRVIDRAAKKDLAKGTPLDLSLIDWES